MDYFYNDALRWSFGFDNPNKAAVLFACALPLAWAAWALAWRSKGRLARGMAASLSALLVLAAAGLLFKTYSRGGAVAGACALAYMLIRAWSGGALRDWKPKRVRLIAEGLLLAAIGGMLWWTGLAGRLLEPVEGAGDASVENRLVLWKRGLQMAADNPAGFGAGRSGAAYMNWYQPVEMTAGYRTMVNSYLTALVEWGWPAFGMAMLAAAFCWGWGNPARGDSAGGDAASGLRAAILAFAAAGIFSTTMEEGVLWILPGLCLLVLLGWSVIERRPLSAALPSMAAAVGGCAILYAAGGILSARDDERRQFSASAAERGSVRIGPQNASGEEWVVVPDEAVLGASCGKLLRPLAKSLRVRLNVRSSAPRAPGQLMLAGDAVRDAGIHGARRLVLLAPEAMEPSRADALLGGAAHALIFVPDIDEDGRAEFWRGVASDRKGVEVVTVEGVGRQVDWGWEQVIERLRRASKE
ncbi:MAG: O-antigen ligase family protein [Terrimicrobiaceae bacterium]|nr:O-antigen ligase family protein [Terrimicrobiaceae bacterium]